VTGWAQLNYPYGSSVSDAKNKLEFDLYYVKNQSIFLDFMVLLQTAEVVIFGKGAH
jgi:lipopolysaccharide/colanic/teichoic acid biosynthesis glycosyltransferase